MIGANKAAIIERVAVLSASGANAPSSDDFELLIGTLTGRFPYLGLSRLDGIIVASVLRNTDLLQRMGLWYT